MHEESLIEASLQDQETQTHISSQNQIEQQAIRDECNYFQDSPITSVSNTEDDDFADSGYNNEYIISFVV